MNSGTELRLWEALDSLATSVHGSPEAYDRIQRLCRRRASRRRAAAGALMLLAAPAAAAGLVAFRRRSRSPAHGLRATPP